MKKIVIALLCVAAMVSVALSATKDTVLVTSDITTGTEGNLNNAVSAVINEDPTGAKLSNTVFKLEHNGYYILTGTITTPPHAHLTIVAPKPGLTQEKSMPQIAWTTSGGVATTINFDCYGDLTMENIWILCATTAGTQSGSSIVIEDDSLANLSGTGEHAYFDGCIIDYKGIGNGGGAIEPACKNFRCVIKNTYFRNCVDSHYRYYGRAVSWTYQSTTWHTDTLIFENCTFANMGYAYMQESPEYGDHVSFNHCTFVNTMMFTLESTFWWWLSVTNSVFLNAYMFGYAPAGDGANAFGGGGLVAIDSIVNFGFAVPFSDSKTDPAALQRHILLANNSYGHEQWYIDFLVNNPYMPATDADKVHRMPAISARTYNFLTGTTDGVKNFPYMSYANNIPAVDTTIEWPPMYNAAGDPGFTFNPCNVDSIKAFLLGRWSTGKDVNWAYDPTSDVQQLWPMNEDLSYSNATLKTAAMGGFPLGDLYHWWGPLSAEDKYTAWKAQKDAEDTRITNWQLTGIDPNGGNSVKQLPGNVPAQFTLNQNYPNPFNPTTMIDYSVPVKGFVSLKIYNILGQEVATIFSGVQPAGNYSATFDGSRLASGVYMYSLQSEGVSITKKLVLMK
jgi:hypothetical protein